MEVLLELAASWPYQITSDSETITNGTPPVTVTTAAA